MALGMPRPTKHTKTGVYYVNVRVPADLVAQVGRTHKKKTLGTKDPQVAKERFPEVLATIQAEWQVVLSRFGAAPLIA